MTTTPIATANSSDELLSVLSAIHIAVPGRAGGPTKEDKERWTVCRLLSSLAYVGELAYPITATHARPPDPDIILTLGSDRVGVEVTEATSEAYSVFLDFLAKKEEERPTDSITLIDEGAFRPGTRKRARKRKERFEAMEAEANKIRLSSGWDGSVPEYEWVNYVVESAQKKIEKAPTYFGKCQKIWLLVYVNAPLPNIHYEDALSILIPKVENFWSLDQCFDTLYVMDGSTIIKINSEGWSKIFVYDLWKSNHILDDLNDSAFAESDQELWNRIVHSDMRELESGLDAEDDEEKE